jgi:signal peptidase I
MVGAALMLGLHAFAIQVSVVRGHSMEPSLHDGDRLVVDRVSYGLGDVARGDVVVLRCPRDRSVDYVKRIVAVPGDRLAMVGGVLRVNGVPCDDYNSILDVQDLPERVIPAGHVFVLGDNRPISCDSREFGLVPLALLRGKVRLRFWPLATAAIF